MVGIILAMLVVIVLCLTATLCANVVRILLGAAAPAWGPLQALARERAVRVESANLDAKLQRLLSDRR